MLVLPALDVEPVVGASVALDLLVQLTKAEDRWEGSSHLSRTALFVIPAPDPDAWFPGAAARGRDLDRNFPVRWDPWLAGGESPGPYPLSEPESRALAEFALDRPELGVAVLLRGPRRGSGRSGSPAKRVGGHAGGSLEAFLEEGLATRVLDDADQIFREATRGLRLDGWSFSRAVAGMLPRLELEPGRLERLDRDLWQLDLELVNTGGTGTALGELSRESGQVQLGIDGATLVTLGRSTSREPFDPALELLDPGQRDPAFAPLGAGERARLRLWLRGGEDLRCRLVLRSPRAGVTETEIQLR